MSDLQQPPDNPTFFVNIVRCYEERKWKFGQNQLLGQMPAQDFRRLDNERVSSFSIVDGYSRSNSSSNCCWRTNSAYNPPWASNSA